MAGDIKYRLNSALCQGNGLRPSGQSKRHITLLRHSLRTVRCLYCSNFSLRQLQKPQQNPDTHHLCKGSNQRSRECKTLAIRPQNSLHPYSHVSSGSIDPVLLSQDGEEIRRFGIWGITICACTAHCSTTRADRSN